ncbi:MAG: D-alanyl-D-alanine carboxypeptidase/D-alanyl-D-alanine-endopeptidase [Prevotellaceae bacterium]|jgi:D-alanyl-D-alanine carboxypeptidase/D-alanyl-D-alanine-endopeptidase (penicillin-binding protein 4)|nr:D-alanyl-D-alanine carboxypeptidase/D-alanyl-D-alanine-endopeptidase [Prevotellaceae bacterium]
MKIRLIYSFVLLFSSASPLFAQNNLAGASIGFVLTDLATGENLISQNSNMCLTPASINKLITTAAALEILGADFRFKTDFSYSGNITDSVLNGNLYIVGGGDPTLCSKYFDNSDFSEQLCNILKANKITQINGDIIVDASIFDKEPIPSGWSWNDIGNYYAAGIYGLSIFDNTTNITFSTLNSTPEITNISPQVQGLVIENNLIAKKGVGDSAYFYGRPYENFRQVFGAIEKDRDAFLLKADIPNPPLVTAQYVVAVLGKNGIKVKGKATDVLEENQTKTLLYQHFSEPLSTVLLLTNYHSNNNFTEHILKYLSLQTSEEGNFEGGIKVVKQFWKSKELNTETLFMLDGSGLSPHNAVCVNFLNDVLIYMAKESKNSEVFFQSLPVAGVSGTVHNFLKNTELQDKVHLKSGSIARVQCYAGYIVDNEKKYSFVIMVNNFSGKRKEIVKEIENKIINAIEQCVKS